LTPKGWKAEFACSVESTQRVAIIIIIIIIIIWWKRYGYTLEWHSRPSHIDRSTLYGKAIWYFFTD